MIAAVFRASVALGAPRIVGLAWSRKSDQTSMAGPGAGDSAGFSGCLASVGVTLSVFARIYNLVLILMRF